jgi:PAS domain S-box-containing protein
MACQIRVITYLFHKAPMKQPLDIPPGDLDYRALFLHLPVGVIVAKRRVMIECNERVLEIFRARRTDIIGKSFAVLYPEDKDFESTGARIEPLLARRAVFTDDRIMRRIDGSHFWVTVRGYGFNPHDPYELATWTFDDCPGGRHGEDPASALTQRERDVAALLVDGCTSKEIGKKLTISPRTVDVHRAALLKKYGVKTTSELIRMLIA